MILVHGLPREFDEGRVGPLTKALGRLAGLVSFPVASALFEMVDFAPGITISDAMMQEVIHHADIVLLLGKSEVQSAITSFHLKKDIVVSKTVFISRDDRRHGEEESSFHN